MHNSKGIAVLEIRFYKLTLRLKMFDVETECEMNVDNRKLALSTVIVIFKIKNDSFQLNKLYFNSFYKKHKAS